MLTLMFQDPGNEEQQDISEQRSNVRWSPLSAGDMFHPGMPETVVLNLTGTMFFPIHTYQ